MASKSVNLRFNLQEGIQQLVSVDEHIYAHQQVCRVKIVCIILTLC